jgi:hypothetical protein
VSRNIPGLEFSAYSSNAANHTYEIEADALTDVGHRRSAVDAQAILFDFRVARGLSGGGRARV